MRIIFVWVICVTNTGAPWMEIEISDWPEVVKVRIGQVLWPRPDRAFSITTWTAIRPSTYDPCKVIVYTAVAPGSNVVYQSTVVLNGIFLKLTILPLKVGTATVPPLTELASQLNKWFFLVKTVENIEGDISKSAKKMKKGKRLYLPVWENTRTSNKWSISIDKGFTWKCTTISPEDITFHFRTDEKW